MGQRFLPRIERLSGPALRVLLGGQTIEMAPLRLTQQFGAVDPKCVSPPPGLFRLLIVDSKPEHRHTESVQRMTTSRDARPSPSGNAVTPTEVAQHTARLVGNPVYWMGSTVR